MSTSQNRSIALACFLSLCLMGPVSLSAQKIGHVNLLNVMDALPAAEQADAQVQQFSDVKAQELEEMRTQLQNDYEALLAQRAQLTPKDFEAKMKNISRREASLNEKQTEFQKAVYEKRKELFEPIFQRVQEAIVIVGSENNYHMILDESKGALLFATESEDISELVRQQLDLE